MKTTTLLALAVLSTTACDRRSSDAPAETRTTGATPSIEQVKDAPSRFYGKRITLTGEVEAPSADAKTFRLEGNEWLFDRDIRVLAKAPVKLAGAALASDDDVIVSGVVRPFVVAEVERELGWDLSPELEVELRERPVLVADRIFRIEPSAVWTAEQPEGELVGMWMLAVAATPDSLLGQKVSLDKAKVQSVSGKGIFIGPSHGDQTFVLPRDAASLKDVAAGDLVDVRGTVKRTPQVDNAMKEFGLPATMRGVVQAEPVYVEATEVKESTPPKKK